MMLESEALRALVYDERDVVVKNFDDQQFSFYI